MKSIPPKLLNEIKKVLPQKQSKVGRPEKCSAKAFLGMFYVLKNGSLWHQLPEKFGKPSTVYSKFMK